MRDANYQQPRLAALYDLLDSDRSDLDVYVDIARELDAQSVLDVGCGTGTFALMLADDGLTVAAVDPAGASLAIAEQKPNSARVRWISGDATDLPPLQVDLATMTGNVAQAIVEPEGWNVTLAGVHRALRPGGCLVFESRRPACRAWEQWNRSATHALTPIPGGGSVETWNDVLDVAGPLVIFRETFVFTPGGETLTSESTLRFREQDEIAADLTANDFVVQEIRQAPDRPGREFVFFARRRA